MPNHEKSIVVIFYPKRIIIATRIGDKYGSVWTRTDRLTILQVEVSDEELGNVALRHLELSVIREIPTEEHRDLRERYCKLTKFKTEGQAMKDSKMVSVYLAKNKIRLEPKENRYSQVRRHYYEYLGMPEAKFEIDYPCTLTQIGLALREASKKCLIT
ncbi:MAG TPA: hypothetical protein VG890_13920 [Puia sp.]|nr:hypothetical protein [Puia sp.]